MSYGLVVIGLILMIDSMLQEYLKWGLRIEEKKVCQLTLQVDYHREFSRNKEYG